MSAALTQLVALGAENQYLTGSDAPVRPRFVQTTVKPQIIGFQCVPSKQCVPVTDSQTYNQKMPLYKTHKDCINNCNNIYK